MSSFDSDHGVIILEPSQWEVLQRMIIGPVAERVTYAEGAPAGLEDLGVIDRYGLTAPVREILGGLMIADARYSLRRLDPNDSMPVRDITIWLAAPRCTVERYDADGVHLYACDDVDVPHIALANDHLYPRPMVHDGPESVYDTLAAAARLADVDAAVRIMRSIGRSGPAASDFVHDAKADRWTMVMRLRQDRDRDGFTATGELLTLGVSNMTYVLEEDHPARDGHRDLGHHLSLAVVDSVRARSGGRGGDEDASRHSRRTVPLPCCAGAGEGPT